MYVIVYDRFVSLAMISMLLINPCTYGLISNSSALAELDYVVVSSPTIERRLELTCRGIKSRKRKKWYSITLLTLLRTPTEWLLL
jgi:hypothetical protein